MQYFNHLLFINECRQGYINFDIKETKCKENFINKEPLSISRDKKYLIKV